MILLCVWKPMCRESSATGDDMNLGLWITVAIVSLVGIAGGAVFFLKKKKKENGEGENTSNP